MPASFATSVSNTEGETEEDKANWDEALIAADDDTAVSLHLAAGQCVYYIESETPDGLVVREHPSGARELISIDEVGKTRTVRSL